MEYEFSIEGSYYAGSHLNHDPFADLDGWEFFETGDLIDELNGPNGTTLIIQADDLESAVHLVRAKLGELAANKFRYFDADLWWQNPPDCPCRRVHKWG